MRYDAKKTEGKREAIHHQQAGLNSNNAVYQPGEQFLREHGVFFHKLREIIQAGGYTVISSLAIYRASRLLVYRMTYQ